MMRLEETARPHIVLAMAIALAVTLLAPVRAGAQAYLFGGYHTEEEVRLLPPYCRYAPDFRENMKGGMNPVELERWREKLGELFGHIHHWCYGLIGMNRTKFRNLNKEEKDWYCRHMISEATYVLNHSTRSHPLWPEFLTMRGTCQLQLKNLQGGFRDLRFAMDLRPDYWPPYVVLSDFLKGLGDNKQARDVLQEGLSHSPDSKTLKVKLAELGGGKEKHPADPGTPKKASAPDASKTTPAAPETETPAKQ